MSVSLIASAFDVSGQRPAGLILAIFCALSACTALPPADEPQEYLDNDTAATVSVVGRPLIFAHDRPNLAVHMRDYVTLAAASVNRSGKTDYVLIAYFWTTFDPHGQAGSARARADSAAAAASASGDTLILAADDRRIELTLQGHSAHEAGIGLPVHAPPGQEAQPNVYRTDLATLRFIAHARHLAVLKGLDLESRYELWEDRRGALLALVRLLSGEDSAGGH